MGVGRERRDNAGVRLLGRDIFTVRVRSVRRAQHDGNGQASVPLAPGGDCMCLSFHVYPFEVLTITLLCFSDFYKISRNLLTYPTQDSSDTVPW